ncbi:phage tail protein [Pseudomonas veronii]|uniref:phage tail protein n=1 Tax=Pseudomonas veronii TaxID=76761 RepID=UPI00159FCE8F|nr:phage tail protein [Pseudomonas veronii]NWD57260.1 phage tail protein [Pseudomonas veronii]
MGAARKIDIHGAKGGEEKPKTPTEAPDSLRSVAIAKMLIAIGEGEFEGTPTARDIYLDNTPLQDPQGNMNFPNVKWEWRTGAVDQTYIQGIPSIENETTISTELRSGTPWVRAITNTQLSAVRVRFAWPALQSVDASGNINGYRIEYKVELATDGGAYQQVLSEAVDGKTTSLYERTRRIDLPRATTGWLMRITRVTINQNNNKISDTMQIAGFTEVIDAKIRYPNTALLYIEFSAEQFRSIPAVTVETKLKKMQVPSNYDPASRSYTGIWDGTFKQAWTDNAVWMTYDITTADRFGLGRRIKPWMVDKWELYRISQYCDQLVPDGKGGQEPRFICNLNLQSKADAWSLLRDISAIYRGMTYWAQGQVFTLADMPRATDFDFAYTRANVIDGKFTYSSASERTRYTRALISYDNPLNNYDTDVTAVTDQKLQRRYGDNPLEISAIGCTRESEAQRRGKWALLTNSKDRAVTFKVGLDGRIPLPGYVIPIADELLAGRPVGGRIAAVNGKVITLDRDTQAKPGDRLILNLPDGKCEGRTVQLVSGRQVTVTVAYSVAPERELVWALDADDLAIPLYRVVSVARPEPGVFEISAVQYDPSKFAHIDTGARLEERPISVVPITVVPAPASVTLTSSYAVNQGIAISTMNISWPAVNGAVAYDVEWRKDSGNWIKVQRTGSTSVDVTGIYSGAYIARVRSVSAFEISSIWKSSNLTNLEGKVGLPPAVSFLITISELFGIGIKWGFPPGAEDTQRTELWYGPANNLQAATKLADLAYPQADYRMQQLLAGAQFFFWARLVDRTGNVGPFYPVVNGVVGQASAQARPILDLIAGQIGETELGKDLLDRIDLIDGPAGLVGSVSSRLKELDDQLQAQIDAIADIADSAAYDPEKSYTAGQSVLFTDGILYQAKGDVPAGAAPPDATYWLNVGQAVTTANGLAARVSTSETKITNIEGVNTAQSTQITGLQTSLTTTNGNVTAAQNAANAANTLAGGKGKVLVQTATPAAADQLVQNLWIDITGGANTPKRWSGTAWVAVTDKVATDAAAAAANALALATTKADASAVQSLTTRVTSAEGTISSQGTAITGLNNSLTTTNTNVTAAQNAANAANTLAGGKGKVIVQAAAPAVADRLAQNLWIDITGGANTPKRWTGSVWEPVTDKVATDAAAAAASALTVANTKADASAVTSLSNTVTQQGNTIAAQGTAVTGLTNRIANAEGVNTAQSEAITQIDSKVTEIDGKATSIAAAFNALRASARDDSGNGAKADALKGWASTSAIVEESKVRATAIEAEATKTTQLQATVGQNTSAIQETSSALANTNGQLSTLWSVKMETTAGGQKYAAAFGLGLQVDPSGVSSQFVVRADTFMLLNLANGTPVSPFAVTGGQTFINSAFIQDGTITNAKIGNYIQSNNYVAGASGWKLFFDGTFEINGSFGGQARQVINNRGGKVFDENGVKRYQWGDLSA